MYKQLFNSCMGNELQMAGRYCTKVAGFYINMAGGTFLFFGAQE